MRHHILKLTLATAAIVFAACNPRVFVDLEEDAPTVAINKPSTFDRQGFGATLAVVEGQLSNGADATRIAVGAGPDTPTFTFDVWNQNALGGFMLQTDTCADLLDCNPGTGASIVGARVLNADETCVAIGEPGTGALRFRCATRPTTVRVPGPTDASQFGASLAAVPRAAASASRVQLVIGAPGDVNEDGELFVFAPTPVGVLSLADAESDREVVPFGAQLGATVATAALPAGFAGTTLSNGFLLAARLGGTGRIVIYQAGLTVAGAVGGADQLRAEVLACIDAPTGMDAATEFGGVLTAGDVIGDDGIPELYVGYSLNAPAHSNQILAVNLADLTTPGAGCGRTTDGPALTPVVLGCPADRVDDEACEDAKFGSAIAIGDVDADGLNDLVVGAPHLDVDGAQRAGAVFAIAGDMTALDVSEAALMTHSDPGEDDLLGTAVAAAPSHLNLPGIAERAEVIGGAPGRNTVYVFLCSGLGADRPSIGERCIELPDETTTP